MLAKNANSLKRYRRLHSNQYSHYMIAASAHHVCWKNLNRKFSICAAVCCRHSLLELDTHHEWHGRYKKAAYPHYSVVVVIVIGVSQFSVCNDLIKSQACRTFNVTRTPHTHNVRFPLRCMQCTREAEQ